MPRNYAALPYDYSREMRCLDDAEFGRLCRALLTYSESGVQIELSGNERFFAERVMMQEDRFQESYNDVSAARRSAGRAGAAARWDNGNDGKRIFANGNDGKRIFANGNDGKNGNTETNTETNEGDIARARRFTPPTLAEVQAYVSERHSPVDPQGFIDFYASKGWMVGKTPMKDWKAACRNAEKWERWSANSPDKPYPVREGYV